MFLLAACADVEPVVPDNSCTADGDCASGECRDGNCVATDVASDVTSDRHRPDSENGDQSGEDLGSVDTGDDTGGDRVTSPDSEPEVGGFGVSCDSNNECESGYCIDTDEGRVCTELCIDECPEGFVCRVLINSGVDAVQLCVPIPDVLCRPCGNHTECGGFGSFCLSQDNGSFCAIDCSPESLCPDGYHCNANRISDGGPDGDPVDASLCEPVEYACHLYELTGLGLTGVADRMRSDSYTMTGRVTANPHRASGPTLHLSGGF